MRVLLVSHRYPPDRIAGVELYTQTLAAELVRAGNTVSVVARRPAPSPRVPRILRERLPDGSWVYRLVGGEASPNHFWLHHERLEQLFEGVMLEAAPEVVHINHLIDLSPRFVEIAQRHRAAVVLTLHDFYFACPLVHLQKRSGELCEGPDGGAECARTCFADEGPPATLRWGLRAAYFRRLLALPERVIAPSRYLASYFERFGAVRDRLRVIPNGMSLTPAERVGQAPSTLRQTLKLAFLGAVVPYKGAHVILEALRIAKIAAVELSILGLIVDRDYARSLRELSRTVPGLRFRMYGMYEQPELAYLLSDVDCVVIPSQLKESAPLVMQEALVRGVPVVASRLGGLTENVVEGENGFTFDHRSPAELAAILRHMAEDDGLVSRLRAGAARTSVMTMPAHAAAVRLVYQEAVEELGRGGAGRSADVGELRCLHTALVDLGFAAGG